jgi:uncharacterized membrane protein YgcG
MCFWLTIWTFAVAGLIIGIVQSWKLAFAGGHASLGLIGKAVFLSLFSLPFIAGEGFGIFLLSKFTSFIAVAFLVASVLIHLLFHYLLKAPTAAGAKLLDEVIGFKQFLGAVDGDRLNRAMPPNQDSQTFEKFLPYALALDVEKAWAEKFSGILGTASQAPNNGDYSPAWYSGASWTTLGAVGFASSMSSSLTSAISSSSTAPGSSGGGGGSGGSGGGGGGGGGGGW